MQVRGARYIARKSGQLHLHLPALLRSGRRVVLDIAEGLAFLHARQTLHADLKPRSEDRLLYSCGSTAAGAAWASGSGCCLPSCRHPLLISLRLQHFASVALPTVSPLPQQRAAESELARLPGRPEHVARAEGHSMHSTRRHSVLRRWAAVHSVTHLPWVADCCCCRVQCQPSAPAYLLACSMRRSPQLTPLLCSAAPEQLMGERCTLAADM